MHKSSDRKSCVFMPIKVFIGIAINVSGGWSGPLSHVVVDKQLILAAGLLMSRRIYVT